MTLPAPVYDLTLVLDTQLEDAARAKIVVDSRAAIEAQGELLRHDDWGERALAYPIERRATGEYHLMQFHAGAPELLSGLSRTLHITDGILRFRIIKLKPGVPEAPDMGSAAAKRPEAPEASAPTASDAPAAPDAPAPAASEAPAASDAPAPAAPDAPAPAAPDAPAAPEQDAAEVALAEPS